MDVVALSSIAQSRMGDGTGNFDAPVELESHGSRATPKSLALGDMDGDGDLDVIVVYNRLSSGAIRGYNRILFNDGNGYFDPVYLMDLTSGLDFYESLVVALADVNGDGALDVAIGDKDPWFWRGKGSGAPLGRGSFALPNLDKLLLSKAVGELQGGGAFASELQPSAKIPTSLLLGDVNGDGFTDLVTCMHGDYNEVQLNDRLGSLGYPSSSTTGSTTDSTCILGDVNGDGTLE